MYFEHEMSFDWELNNGDECYGGQGNKLKTDIYFIIEKNFDWVSFNKSCLFYVN